MNKPNPNQIIRFMEVEDLFIDGRSIDQVIAILEKLRERYPNSIISVEDEHPNVVLKEQRYETPEEAKNRYEKEMDSYKRQEMWERKELSRLKAKYEV